MDLKSLSGVYALWYSGSDSVYVGSSVNLASRALDHIKNRQSNTYLQNAIAKHGLDKFSFYILELLPEDCSSYDDLLDLEQKYLDLFPSPAQSEAVVRFARLRRVFLLDPCQGQAKKTTVKNY
jgi:group I intron endonuclease